MNSARAKASNGVVAVAVATNNCTNGITNKFPAVQLTKQIVFDVQQAAAMNRDWNVKEDPNSSGGKTKFVSKKMETSKDTNSKGQKKRNTKPTSTLKKMRTSKDTNSKGQKKTNRTKDQEEYKNNDFINFLCSHSIWNKVTSSTADNASSKR